MMLYAWFTDAKRSTYGAAVTRMLLGFTIAAELATNFADRHYTWGDGTQWTATVRDAKNWPGFLDVMFVRSGGRLFDIAYMAAIIFGILLMIGFYTRASAILALLMWMSLYVANPFVGSGGDSMLRMVLLYLCFMDSGKRWSVDDWLRRRRGSTPSRMPALVANVLHNTGLVLIIHQIVIVYVSSALWKVQSVKWMDGTAVYYPLHVEAYSPWRDHIHLLTDHGSIVWVATYTAIGIQLLLPVLLIYRPSRIFALLTVLGMHLGIGLFLGILFFSLVMVAADALLISDKNWERLALWSGRAIARARRRRQSVTAVTKIKI